jgi:hypothetical protein
VGWLALGLLTRHEDVNGRTGSMAAVWAGGLHVRSDVMVGPFRTQLSVFEYHAL